MQFETDHDRRPILKTFIGRPRPKSFVFPTKDDLFEVENEIVDRFARIALRTYMPILCPDDWDHPLSERLSGEMPATGAAVASAYRRVHQRRVGLIGLLSLAGKIALRSTKSLSAMQGIVRSPGR